MSGRAAGFAAGIAIRLLIKALKRKRRHIEEATPPQLTKEQIDQYIVDTTIDEAYEQLQAEYDRAYKELLEREKQVEDPYIRKLIQNIKEYHELFRPKNKMRPPWMLTAILLNEALKNGIKDRDKIYQYILKASWEYAKQIAQILPPKPYQGKHQKAYAEHMRNPYLTLRELTAMINEANKKDPIWRKYWESLGEGFRTLTKERRKMGDTSDLKEPEAVLKYLNLFEEIFHSVTQKKGIEPFWHKTPEEILGIKPSLPEPLSSYEAWLVDIIAQAIKDMDVEEIARLIASCCSGECVLERLRK